MQSGKDIKLKYFIVSQFKIYKSKWEPDHTFSMNSINIISRKSKTKRLVTHLNKMCDIPFLLGFYKESHTHHPFFVHIHVKEVLK